MPQDSTRTSLELLYNISRELATTLDLRTVLGRVLSLSIDNVKAERGTLIILDERQQVEDAAIIFEGQPIQPSTEQLETILRQGLAGWVLRNRQPALVEDTSLDQRWFPIPSGAFDTAKPKSAICIPLTAR
ncbi:MAG: GAF domain-containing protein, partial [Anaerolineaceae bacterium]|nr:GAF domain-containing protein [Anaerolineaceae bacterium]